MIRSVSATLLAVTFLLPPCAALAQSPATQPGGARPAYELEVAGDDRVLWLIAGQWETTDSGGQFLQRFAYMPSDKQRLLPLRIQPQIGRVHRHAVLDGRLHVFLRQNRDVLHLEYDHAAMDVGRRAVTRRRNLPGDAMPEALAAQRSSKGRSLWAVVSGNVAAEVARLAELVAQEAEDEADETDETPVTSPAAGRADRRLSISTRPEPAGDREFHLVRFDGAAWQPGFAAPAAAAGAERVWLAINADEFHFFWQMDSNQPAVHHARYLDGEWREGAVFSFSSPLVRGSPEMDPHGLIFSALVKDPEVLDHLDTERWIWRPGDKGPERWERLPRLTDAQGRELRLSPSAAIGRALGHRIAVARWESRDPEVALWDVLAGGKPSSSFQAAPLAGVATPEGQTFRGLLGTLLVMAILLLVFWRRQDSIGQPFPLPEGFGLATASRRAVAGLIDMLPAAIITGIIWRGTWQVAFAEAYAAAQVGEQPEWSAEVFWAGLAFRLIYIAWCLGFELLSGRTPGKILLGLYIFSENLAPPLRRQRVIRNLTRLFELEPFLLIWPFFLVIFFTRNRQRVGDLLARTVVTERYPVMA